MQQLHKTKFFFTDYDSFDCYIVIYKKINQNNSLYEAAAVFGKILTLAVKHAVDYIGNKPIWIMHELLYLNVHSVCVRAKS